MEKEKVLNEEILALTAEIREKYPELEKFLGELPGTLPDTEHPEINSHSLRDYRDTLKSLIKNYIPEHIVLTKSVPVELINH